MTEQQTPERRSFGPEVVATRLVVRRALRGLEDGEAPLVLVALSGGADSLALALATAHEAPRAGVRAGAVIVDHGLQRGSEEVAAAAAEQARGLGLDPVVVERVRVEAGSGHGGPEAAAREARYAAIAGVASAVGARFVFTGHTRDDQAEQVLLGLARGSGLRSLAGIPARRDLHKVTGDAVLLRPFLQSGPEYGCRAITRVVTEAACSDHRLPFWRDPQNSDAQFARVRVRDRVLPMLESELGPGIAEALARTADLAGEDADALDAIAQRRARELLDAGAIESPGTEILSPEVALVPVEALAHEPAAIRNRVIREIARQQFAAQLDRGHTVAVALLVTEWRGQGPVYVPGIVVTRAAGMLRFARQTGSPRG